jgi:hypothetical protein
MTYPRTPSTRGGSGKPTSNSDPGDVVDCWHVLVVQFTGSLLEAARRFCKSQMNAIHVYTTYFRSRVVLQYSSFVNVLLNCHFYGTSVRMNEWMVVFMSLCNKFPICLPVVIHQVPISSCLLFRS